jgi:hypothetical protein
MPRLEFVLAGALSLGAASAASATPYDDAQPQTRGDALDPQTRDYQLNELRPVPRYGRR